MSTLQGRDPAELRERVTLVRRTTEDDGQLGREESWTDLAANATEWVRIRPISARTKEQGDRASAPRKYEVTMRGRTDIGAFHGVRWEGRVLAFTGDPVNEDERGAYIRFTAAEEKG